MSVGSTAVCLHSLLKLVSSMPFKFLIYLFIYLHFGVNLAGDINLINLFKEPAFAFIVLSVPIVCPLYCFLSLT